MRVQSSQSKQQGALRQLKHQVSILSIRAAGCNPVNQSSRVKSCQFKQQGAVLSIKAAGCHLVHFQGQVLQHILWQRICINIHHLCGGPQQHVPSVASKSLCDENDISCLHSTKQHWVGNEYSLWILQELF